MARATYDCTIIDGNAYVIDRDIGMSVTNDAEAVVYEVTAKCDGRIIYRDTDGRWDELKKRGREFVCFAPIRPEDPILKHTKSLGLLNI